jgi:23S rRNA (adenine2030-N6)-methyltransferase
MNYRHAYHAGNHGDVLKHIVLSRVLTYFMQKDAAFAVLDAHAGIGVYDLLGLEAFKTGEWKEGIGKLLQATVPDDAAALFASYLSTIRSLNKDKELKQYPGSPDICRQLLRKQDRLLLNELHSQDCETLAARYPHAKVSQVDALQVVKANLPLLEKRGVLLIDPPYEVTDETARVSKLLTNAMRRMANLCVVLWYPITTQVFADKLIAALDMKGLKSVLRLELLTRKAEPDNGMAGSGLIVVNPPWTLFQECEVMLPVLRDVLQQGRQGKHKLEWLVQPT